MLDIDSKHNKSQQVYFLLLFAPQRLTLSIAKREFVNFLGDNFKLVMSFNLLYFVCMCTQLLNKGTFCFVCFYFEGYKTDLLTVLYLTEPWTIGTGWGGCHDNADPFQCCHRHEDPNLPGMNSQTKT